MTTFMNVDAFNHRVEIGSTWYAARVQRTALNTECKLLLLTHAFEQLQCIAVELRTHVLNTQSRRAIERLGAKLDGTLRNHMRMPNGTLRDTVVYSIIDSEWPTVRAHLRWQLEKEQVRRAVRLALRVVTCAGVPGCRRDSARRRAPPCIRCRPR